MNAPKGEETIFAEALCLPPEERAAYLAQAASGDIELRRRVESLLGSYGAGDFLEQAAAPQLRPTVHVTVPLTEKAGDRIGRYKLLEQIGEGGCGVVYVAEQTEPVRRRVALKIIKLGMDTKSVIARFEAERQALAMMDHPNIAKVFDAGSTERPLTRPSGMLSPTGGEGRREVDAACHPRPSDERGAGGEGLSAGRPYFVMELVRGMKITEFCDEKKLSTGERLDLFIQVCQAIQHAHQKGIIHRDIKPSNILVTVNDGVPVPKVIDFGIAKATTGQHLTDKTIYTAFEQFIGTPAYMSPEQAMLTSLDIDTRSDIYALGVLLYELLTGKTPFDAEELFAIGLDEMRRTIREQEPPRPSTRLSTLPGQELSTTAQRRGLDAPKLVSELRGDLDWIVMKALEKDRARRYETANGLAADIQRHLNNEPVVACPPSRLYRLRKTIQRNKLTFSAAAAVAAALVLGVLVSAWQSQRAKAERDSAEAVLNFFRDHVLAVVELEGNGRGFGLGRNITLREALDAAEPEISASFQNRPLVEAAIRETLGNSYSGLGEQSLAIQQAERVLALRRRHLGFKHPDTVKVMASLGRRYVRVGKFEQGLPLLENALKLRKSHWGLVHSNTLENMQDLGNALLEAGKQDQSFAVLGEALTVSKAGLGPGNLETLEIMHTLGNAYRVAGKLKQALVVLEEALQLSKARPGPEHKITGNIMNDISLVYIDSGKPDEAIPLLEKVIESFKARRAPEDEILAVMHNRADAFRLAGKADRAVSLYEELLQLERAKLGAQHPGTLITMECLAIAYVNTGKTDQALPLLEDVLKQRTATLGANHRLTLGAADGLANAYRDAGKLDQALPLFEETLELVKAKQGPDHSDTLEWMFQLALVYREARKFDQALPLFEETLKLVTAKQGPEGPGTLNVMNHTAIAYANAGKLDQALPLFEETLKLRKSTLGPDNSDTKKSMHNLVEAYRATGKLDQLEAMYREQLAQQSGDVLKAEIELGRLLLERSRSESTNAARSRELEREGEQLVREYMSGARSRYTNDPLALASKLYDVADPRYRQGNYAEAEPLYREIVELRRAHLKADDKDVLDPTASLARLLSDWAWAERTNTVAADVASSSQPSPSERAREAERLLRQVLAVRFRDSTNSWRIGDTKSRLGGALVSVAVTDPTMDAQRRETKFSEAESLLLEGYERLQNSYRDEKYYRDAFDRIDRLYEAWNKSDQRSEWQHRRAAYDARGLAESALRLLQQEKFTEAEAPARACLAFREKNMPDDWPTFNARSMLGGSLLGQKKYSEAEPLLLSGYEGMVQREEKIPFMARPRLKETLQRLVQLYEATSRPEDAARWKQKLAQFEQKEEQRRTAISRRVQSQDSSSKTNHPPK